MKKRGRRILSVILTAVMVFALLPVFSKPMVVKADDIPAHVAHDKQDTKDSLHSGWEKISTWDDLKKLGEKGGSGYLGDNIEISETFTIVLGKTVNLCLNGFSITQTEDVDTITVKGTLNLYDKNDKKNNSGEITHSIGKDGRGIYIDATGTFTMNGGTISENNPDHGGGVINYGTFTMTEGTIKDNMAVNGGGVFNVGTFTMNGGTISGNTVYGYGGGVTNSGTFTMEGGTISGNYAVYEGGGVNNSGTFTMIKGAIKDNEAKEKGSGVYSSYSFVKEGGEIDGSIESRKGTFCSVTFNSNDKTDKTIIQYVIPNTDTNLYSNKFSYGNYGNYEFGCWNESPDGYGDSYQDNATININSNLVLYARWIEESYNVTFKVYRGSWPDGTKEDKVVPFIKYVGDKELKLNASKIPSINPITGYKGCWDTEPDTENALTENKTYSYTFAPIEYTVKFDANDGVGTMLDQSRTYDDKAPLTTNTFTFEGKTFNGWNTEADGSGTSYADGEVNNISSKDGDTVTLYAQWTIDTFTIAWKDYNGTVLETDTNVAYGAMPEYNGESPKRDNAGNIKYTFAGWTPEVDTVKGATTYTATYSEEEIVEPTEPTTPEEPTNPTTPEEPTEPGTEDLTDPGPDPEIPERDWLDDLRLQLQIAAELGGPQTVEYSGDFALSYDIMLYLVEHPDITLIYTVTYEGVEYTITIPGGKAIADSNIPWYGPLWLLANYGGDKVPEIMAGSGRYTVVAGDTLSGIAAKFNTTVEELAKKNGIKNPDYIIVGQVIVY